MINKDSILHDNIEDDVSPLLHAMDECTGWTKEKRMIANQLVELLSKKKYICFSGSPYRYLCSQIGDYYLYDVPLYKQGYLKIFRGKRIRIVCVGSGRYTRTYMAGAVGDTPADLIVKKLTYKYSFPSYATARKQLYKTRRFLVFEADNNLKVMTDKEPNGYIDLNEWDSILIDGKIGKPVAKFRHNPDGTVAGGMLNWRGQHISPSLVDVVQYLQKMM